MAKRLRPTEEEEVKRVEPIVIVIEDSSSEEEEEDDPCPICLENYKVRAIPACGHTTCFSCFHQNYSLHKRKWCPLCMSPILKIPSIQSTKKVYAIDWEGVTHTLPMADDMRVADLKAVFSYRTGVHVDELRFFSRGRGLPDKRLLSDCGIIDHSHLFVVLALSGD